MFAGVMSQRVQVEEVHGIWWDRLPGIFIDGLGF